MGGLGGAARRHRMAERRQRVARRTARGARRVRWSATWLRPAGRWRRCSIVRSQRWPSGTISRSARRVVALPATTRTAASARRTAAAEVELCISRPTRPRSGRFSARVILGAPPTGDAGRDAALLLDAIREGAVFSVVDAIAGPGALDFRAAAGGAIVPMGEMLPAATRRRRSRSARTFRRCASTVAASQRSGGRRAVRRSARTHSTGAGRLPGRNSRPRRARHATGPVARQQSDLLVPAGVRRATRLACLTAGVGTAAPRGRRGASSRVPGRSASVTPEPACRL